MGTLIIGGVLAALFAAAIIKIVKDKKKGACAGCSGCDEHAACGKK